MVTVSGKSAMCWPVVLYDVRKLDKQKQYPVEMMLTNGMKHRYFHSIHRRYMYMLVSLCV